MKMAIVVLLLVVCWCLCEAQDIDGKVDSCSGMLSCCGSLNLAQNFGTMGEKVTNMAEKIALLEDKVLNTEKTLLELRSIIGGKSKFSSSKICFHIIYIIYMFHIIYLWPLGAPQVAFSATLRESGSGNTGPFTKATPLQYKKVFSNAGNCYNPSTGWVCVKRVVQRWRTVKTNYDHQCSCFDRHFHSNGQRNVLLSILDVQQPKSCSQFSCKPHEEQWTSDICLGHLRVWWQWHGEQRCGHSPWGGRQCICRAPRKQAGLWWCHGLQHLQWFSSLHHVVLSPFSHLQLHLDKWLNK